MFKVIFQIQGLGETEIYANQGDNLLSLAQLGNVAIDAPCSGNGSCGKCKVRLVSGELESKKTRHISDEEYADGWRLSCCSSICADVTVEVPDIASAYRSRMKVADLSSPKEIEIFEQAKSEIAGAGIELKNDLAVLNIRMEEPSLDDTMPDNERLVWAIREQTGQDHIEMTFGVLQKLARSLRSSGFHVKAVVQRQEPGILVCDLIPGQEEVILGGLAVDIGTTTVSAILTNMETGEVIGKASSGNGQIRYGADVINRIIESEKAGGSARLQNAVIHETINPMIQEICMASGFRSDRIYRMAVAANTTMNHLFLGLDGDPIRREPYIPSFFHTRSVRARDVEVRIAPDARVILAPNIGSYVGGDITAGALVSMIWNRPTTSLFIDLGTNGELVLGNADFLISCACSAGPAFEGGDISCGMRATDGAIESCRIDRDSLEPSFGIIGTPGTKPVGLCGSGLIDVIAELFTKEIINPKGKFVREGDRIRHDKYGMGSYVLAFKEETGGVKDVEITEVDIDNFIRAKGAIFSAVRTMIDYLDFTVDMIDDVYVAGGIGSGINMQNAVLIGMFPDLPLDKFHYIGNSSLTGSYMMLLSNEAEEKTEEISRNMTYLELSTVPTYMDEFVACCFLPHTDDRLFPSVIEKMKKES